MLVNNRYTKFCWNKSVNLLFFFGWIALSANAQILRGEVVDEFNVPVADVKVINLTTADTVFSNATGAFQIDAAVGHELILDHPFFQGSIHTVNDVFLQMSPVYFILEYKSEYQLYDEVVITDQRVKTVLDIRNLNVIDYLPMTNNQVLTISRYNRQKNYLLTVEGMDTTYHTFPIDLDKPEYLEIDCFRNVQIVCLDSVFQVSIENELRIIDRISRMDYDEFVSPCLARWKLGLIFEAFTMHNKRYEVFSKMRVDPKPSQILEIYDEEMARVGESYYNEIIQLYYKHQPIQDNVIELGVWSGNLIELAVTGKIIELITWYDKIIARKLYVNSFDAGDTVVVLDGLNGAIYQIPKRNLIVEKTIMQLPKNYSKPTFILDDGKKQLYVYNSFSARLEVSKINKKTGELTTVLNLHEVRFPLNIKIMNGWLYYLKSAGNGFFKLYKVRLEN
jgi:hypothetical protein